MAATLAILTVGTGTSGIYSNVAQGLVNTLRALQPRAFWLVPSASTDSIALAELIRDEVCAELPGRFAAWSPEGAFRLIAQHDSLEDCRSAVREVIRRAAKDLRDGERLLVNPTSGTKQMSAGATLAALDESLGELVFTVGERQDGVVKTGWERIQYFDASVYHSERDLILARELFTAGSHSASARVLEKHHSLARHAAAARSVHEWCRLKYRDAAAEAVQANAPWASHLNKIKAVSQTPCALLVADLLDATAWAHQIGDWERTLTFGYKTLEAAVQWRALDDLGLAPPYQRDDLLSKTREDWLANKIHTLANDAGVVRLGFRALAELLRQNGEPFGVALLRESKLLDLVEARNAMTHGIRPTNAMEAREMVDRVEKLLRAKCQLPRITPRPNVLPSL